MRSAASEIIRRSDRMAGVAVTGPPKARGRFMSGFASALDVVVMAAGKGTRMKSSLPKVLHRVAGKAMVRHVLDTVEAAPRRVVLITGHGAEGRGPAGRAPLRQEGRLQFARQLPQLGTGHAVQQAVPCWPTTRGADPQRRRALIAADTVQALVQACAAGTWPCSPWCWTTPRLWPHPARGRKVLGIVEHKDASEAQRAIPRPTPASWPCPPRAEGLAGRLRNDNARASTT
jgi:bifunctional UDP-N-acetylglucosamine pyrophosphorylase/glucosamine-1-phosphate N-acetyltransferase